VRLVIFVVMTFSLDAGQQPARQPLSGRSM